MRILITAGPTREAIDPVRYIGNRSSGKMGAALAEAATRQGNSVTLVLGPVSAAMPTNIARINIESAAQMHEAVLQQFPRHDLLIMAAAVADYRPKVVSPTKMTRAKGPITLELEPTPDIAAAASAIRRSDQRIIGFSLEREGDLNRARQKMMTKKLDMIVFNPVETMESESIRATFLWPNGRSEQVPYSSKTDLADILLKRAVKLFA
jgi:phosphopantothenoylcysteine decarboxylase/phosphopantothenate--cysteine ligase